MATQIASTPVVKGKEAVKILKEANRVPSAKVKKGSRKLADIFEKMTIFKLMIFTSNAKIRTS